MVAKELLDYFQEFNVLKAVGVEDSIDRLNSLVTVAVLLVCVLVVAVKQYVLSPIACFVSQGIKADQFMDYVTTYCWTHGTIPLKEDETVFSFPHNEDWDRLDQTRRITYYQWVPFVLCLQAVMFHLPRLLWSVVCRNMAGTDMENLISLADQASKAEGASRQKIVVNIAGTLELILQDRRRSPSSLLGRTSVSVYNRLIGCCFRGAGSDLGGDSSITPVARFGSVIRLQYLVVKLIYLANVAGQIILIQYFLGFLRFDFGILLLKNLLSGADWRHSHWFPRVTYCNARNISVFGDSNQRHLAQCCLPLNMLNEKVYLFLWFWFVLVLILSVYSLLAWFFYIVYQPSQDAFIGKLLRMLATSNRLKSTANGAQVELPNVDNEQGRKTWLMFVHRYLRSDGVFLLMMIKANAGDLLVSEVVMHLWSTYRTKKFYEEDLAASQGHNKMFKLNAAQAYSTPEKKKQPEPYESVMPTAPMVETPGAVYPALGFETYQTERV